MAVRLRFSTEPKSILSAFIRWRCDFKISHVEYELENKWTFGSRFPDGVKYRGPEENNHQSHVMHATFPKIEEAYQWAVRNRSGYPYDTWGIFGIATAKDWHCKKGRFCSELIYESAEAVGTYLLNRYTTAWWQIAPRDLVISPAVELEGVI